MRNNKEKNYLKGWYYFSWYFRNKIKLYLIKLKQLLNNQLRKYKVMVYTLLPKCKSKEESM